MIPTTHAQTLSFALFIGACLSVVPPASAQQAAKPATESTKAANAAVLQELPFSDKTAFELAHKGFIAPLPQEMITGNAGNTVWDPKKYSFIEAGSVKITGSEGKLDEMLSYLDTFEFWFPIVTP